MEFGSGWLCVQTISWWEEGSFLAAHQAAVAWLQRWSWAYPATYKCWLQSQARVPRPSTYSADLDLEWNQPGWLGTWLQARVYPVVFS